MNPIRFILSFFDSLRRWISEPAAEATRWQRAARYLFDLVRHCWRELSKDRAPQMASALTYRTIFGLVPFFVLALIVFRAFGGFADVGQDVRDKLYKYLGLSPIQIQQVEAAEEAGIDLNEQPPVSEADSIATTQPTEPTQATAAATTQPSQNAESKQNQAQLRANVERILNNLYDRVSGVSFASIGAVGLVLLIWAALGLVATVEDCFNQIFGSDRGRPWHMRIAIYWAVITLGPVLLMVSMWLTSQVISWINQADVYIIAGAVQMLLNLASRLTAFFATWLLLFLLYVLLPNTSVKIRSALMGSFIAAAFWELAKWGFGLYVQKAVGYSTLYGSLGLIPLFLFWLYLTWLIILFGLELTYTLQMMSAGRFRLEPKPENAEDFIDPHWIIPLMVRTARAFESGDSAGATELSREMALPLRAIKHLGSHLEKAHLLNRVADDELGEPRYALAMPPDRIAISQLLDVGRSLSIKQDGGRKIPGREVLEQLTAAEQQAANDMTLASVLKNQTQV